MSFSECSEKSDIIKNFGRSPNDSGSSEVQIGILTKRLERLTAHFSKYSKDKHSMRGLRQIVAKRNSLLGYLRKRNPEKYQQTIQNYSLRK